MEITRNGQSGPNVLQHAVEDSRLEKENVPIPLHNTVGRTAKIWDRLMIPKDAISMLAVS